MTAQDKPEAWARTEAMRLMAAERTAQRDRLFRESDINAFARYIAQHEQPPVDPDLLLAREVASAEAREHGFAVPSGTYECMLRAALAAIRATRAQGGAA